MFGYNAPITDVNKAILNYGGIDVETSVDTAPITAKIRQSGDYSTGIDTANNGANAIGVSSSVVGTNSQAQLAYAVGDNTMGIYAQAHGDGASAVVATASGTGSLSVQARGPIQCITEDGADTTLQTPPSPIAITGALSAVTDPNAKALLTSIIALLTADYSIGTNSTT